MTLPAPLLQDVQFLKGIGPDRARLLQRMGLRRAVDLLFNFPRAYDEPALLVEGKDFEEKQKVSTVVTVTAVDERFTQTGKHMLGAHTLTRDGTHVRLVFFNQSFRKRDLVPESQWLATGVVKSTVANWEMMQPQLRALEDGLEDEAKTQRPRPIYGLTEGLKQAGMQHMMRAALPPLMDVVEEVLPEALRAELDLPDIGAALQMLHFPEDESQWQLARRRFKLQELLVLQLAICFQRSQRIAQDDAPECEPSGKIHSRILNRIGLALTSDQLKAIDEIGHDMSQSIPMNRLLQGDVGSGKTVVAQYAMLLCVAHGFQAALMAPTEVLAQQHLVTMTRSLSSSRVRTALLTGSLSAGERRQTLDSLRSGETDLVIGTQALLSESVQFKDLGLVVVDEQHKFGVRQRAHLRTDARQPHYLVLSATPIPRTISMTAFGDLDVSTIKEKPPGRSQVHTYTGTPNELQSWWRFVEKQIQAGRQAYVIAPRVDKDDQSQVASAIELFEQLANEQFAHRRVALLHGQMDAREKERTLRAFSDGQVELLVATTVVEVGIDVPNATIMTIVDADRLGLAQLHQLRGRVSRGSHPGYICAIASQGCEPGDNERLAAFQNSNDGFELAEFDLKQRGPGDILGTSQSGLPPLRIADLSADHELVQLSRTTANQLWERFPELNSPDLESLRRQVLQRYGQSLQLSDVG